jgi:DNA-directed RNA polymerase specialized sigma24 family protein
VTADADRFESFVVDARPRLHRAFVSRYGIDGASDATAEALAWAWEHRDRVEAMSNPIGYLYRVGQSRSRRRRMPPLLPAPSVLGVPDVEPELIPALLSLSDRERTAVWLVHACEWRHAEVAEAMGVSASAVATYVGRGLTKLRERLQVIVDA